MKSCGTFFSFDKFSSLTCQGFCWHNHGWPEAVWRCHKVWPLGAPAPQFFASQHQVGVCHSQTPPLVGWHPHALYGIQQHREETITLDTYRRQVGYGNFIKTGYISERQCSTLVAWVIQKQSSKRSSNMYRRPSVTRFYHFNFILIHCPLIVLNKL